jgi:hypothetical protein
MLAKNRVKAANPPAEAPIATINFGPDFGCALSFSTFLALICESKTSLWLRNQKSLKNG